jgi:glyoxylase-like metal-dependent hydrolase (beta-lactamase superfamily II)
MKTAILLMAGAATCAAVMAAGPATVGDYPMRAEKVADDVYAVIAPARDFPNPENKGWNSNSAFVVTRDGVLLIDTGSSETLGQALKKAVAAVSDKPVRWIVNTHGHADHWLGNAAFAGAEIIASRTVRRRIEKESADWVERFNSMTKGATGKSRIAKPTRVVDARTVMGFGEVKAELIPSQDSHSPGDLVVWLPGKGVLITGDVVYSDRLPATFDARIPQWTKFLGELETLKPAKVIPGHGNVADVSAIRRQREYFASLWKLVQVGYDESKPDFEILPTVKKELAAYAKHYPDFDQYIGQSVSHVYLQVEANAFK